MSCSVDVLEAMRKEVASLKKQPSSAQVKKLRAFSAMHRIQFREAKHGRHHAISSVFRGQDATWTSFEYRKHSREHATDIHRAHKSHAGVAERKNNR